MNNGSQVKPSANDGATATISRRPGVSPSFVAPSQSKRIRPLTKQGCTTVSGASSSATISSGQPARPSAVAPNHRLLRTSRPSSDGRNEYSPST